MTVGAILHPGHAELVDDKRAALRQAVTGALKPNGQHAEVDNGI